MNEQEQTISPEYTELTADIVAAFVANNAVTIADLPKLIASVHGALTDLGTRRPEAPAEKPVPPVSIKKSITPDYLISLEDGRQYKSLKRHLAGRGLTPEQYRRKWGLPPDYPMVAPSYAKQRSELAKALGLGRPRAKPAPAQKRGGRRKAA
ncbi:MucR family transcriptional regulator [Enterovirga aerilata]|uniref:MucR family transcriptional regulator n=1 Tax=Enterovirga aerilata TaxID=2730920 RepID=A0A849IA93_9HYPH|nr:MucR family transcriptional regulator [Enterovirga sp. DB1703]NNM72927.1 MucR family transcriptional regulator [Enterovirga sp. DB1703]